MVFKYRILLRNLFAIMLVRGVVAGCGKSDRHGLSGKVTLKGDLLRSGSIQFESVAGQSPAFSTGAVIKEGAFFVPDSSGIPPGDYRVIINAAAAPTLIPGPPGGQAVLEAKELVPAAYNTDSEVTIEVSAEGENAFTFDIP